MDINTTPKYNTSLKGGITGAVVGAAGGAAVYQLTRATMLPLRGETTFSQKRDFINDMHKIFSNHNIEMKGTTVSRTVKSSLKTLKKPSVIASGLLLASGVGTAIGACIDMVRLKKAAKTDKKEV